MADVVLNKIQTIQRCISRIKEEYVGYENSFVNNYTKQDWGYIKSRKGFSSSYRYCNTYY